MTNSSVGNIMYFGVRHFGWIFWLWHRIKQKIGRGGKMNRFDKIVENVVYDKFDSLLEDIRKHP